MNKLAVVLGVAAVATLAGCKDPEYARITPGAQDEAKSIETESAIEEGKAEEIKSEEVKEEVVPTPAEVKPVEPEYTTYIVQRGDYLAKISKKFNIKVGAIKKLNNMTTDNVRLGQKLKLPGKVEVGAQEVPAGAIKATLKKAYESYKGETKEYVVVAGDTLGKIAYSNGMNIRQLKELNGLKKDTVRVGQKLKIAANGQAAAKAPAKPVEAAKPVAQPVVETPKTPEQPVVEEKVPEVQPTVAEKAPEVPAAAEGSTTYVVQEGEALTDVAIEFQLPVAKLREFNNLGEGDEVKPGQVLKIPAAQ